MKILKYIKKNGIEKTVNDFSLIKRDYEKFFLLKYNQIKSPSNIEEVQECRGLILNKKDNKVLSYPFKRFFNIEEPNAVNIDWNSAKVLEKVDGSLIQIWKNPFTDKFEVGTSGTAQGEGSVNNNNLTFAELFNKTLLKYHKHKLNFYYKLLDNYTYLFELCTPWNIVVTPHAKSFITFLSVRNNLTYKELPYEELKKISIDIKIPLVKQYNLNSIKEIKKTFIDMPFSHEGYVVIDKNFNRVKIKNPAYLAAHYLKSKNANYHILTIIKNNEVAEYVSTFKDKKNELILLKKKYNLLLIELLKLENELKDYIPKDRIDPIITKQYAIRMLSLLKKHNFLLFKDLFFKYKNNKIEDLSKALFNYNNKKLYNFLNNWHI